MFAQLKRDHHNHGQRVSKLLTGEDLREEVVVPAGDLHLASQTFFERMVLESRDGNVMVKRRSQLRLLPRVRSRVRLSSSRKFTSSTQCMDSMPQWPRTASPKRGPLR